MKLGKEILTIAVVFLTLSMSGCGSNAPRLGMITDPVTGLQYGSVIGKSFFIDSEQFPNKIIKVTARNVSGDINYDMKGFISDLKESFKGKGYEAYKNDGFGLKVDVVVEYSGHIQSNMSSAYRFLGAGVGYVAGRHSSVKAAEGIGIVTGAALGSVVGSYQTKDTYIIIAKVNIGIMDSKSGKTTRTITFSSSPKLQEDEDDGFKRFKEVVSTEIAVYAGGRNIEQSEVVDKVKRRLVRIVSDII